VIVFRKSPFLFLVLFLVATGVLRAQTGGRQDSIAKAQSNCSGTWSATTNSGVPLVGTWTAVFDTTSGAVTGTWTLVDAQGRMLASGAWSAAKSPTRWNGAWRAVIAGRNGEYSGTWTASADLKSNARLVEMFAKAIQTVVSGTWRMGSQSGAWSIRASP
jgi:hypothetical protein